MACIAGGVVIPGVLSWRQNHHAKQAVMPPGKIPPATFFRGLNSTHFCHLDYPIRKSGVIVNCPANEPSVAKHNRESSHTLRTKQLHVTSYSGSYPVLQMKLNSG